MKSRANKMLGLAIGERSILIAEVLSAGEKCEVTRAGAFAYTEAAALAQPQALGAALGEYLKQQGFAAKAAVVGIPAKWVLTKLKDLPPVDPTLASDMLRLQVESEFSTEIKDLVHDFGGQTSATAPSQILLAATQSKNVDLVREMAKAARLDVQAITPTTMALGAASNSAVADGLILSITPSGTELAGQRGGSPSLLRHVGSTSAVTASVAGEVRRAALMLPRNGSTAGNGSANGHSLGNVVVWNDGGVDADGRRAVMEALGASARSGTFAALGVRDLPAGSTGSAAAVALAVAGVSGTVLPIDFLHSRLAPPKKAVMKRQTMLAIAIGVVMLLIGVLMFVDKYHRENTLAESRKMLEKKQLSLDGADKEIARNEYARNWHANPRYIDCLRDLTNDFPSDGQIFVTSFTMHDNMKGEIGGKSSASTDRGIRDLVDRLRTRKDHRFLDVEMKSVDKRQIRLGQEISFTITFKYVPAEPSQQ